MANGGHPKPAPKPEPKPEAQKPAEERKKGPGPKG